MDIRWMVDGHSVTKVGIKQLLNLPLQYAKWWTILVPLADSCIACHNETDNNWLGRLIRLCVCVCVCERERERDRETERGREIT